MKKIITVLSLSSLIFTACKKNEQIAPTPNQQVITSSSTNTTPTNTTPTNGTSKKLFLEFGLIIPQNFSLSYKYDTNNVHILLNGVELRSNEFKIYRNLNSITSMSKIFNVYRGDTITFKVDSVIYCNDNHYRSGCIQTDAHLAMDFRVYGNSPVNGVPIGRYLGSDSTTTTFGIKDKWYVGLPYKYEHIVF